MNSWIHDLRPGKGVSGLKDVFVCSVDADDVFWLRYEPGDRRGRKQDDFAVESGEHTCFIMDGVLWMKDRLDE